jgi:hypothetical protein
MVPFEKYAAAAQSLTRPASAARALQNGAPNIERADKLVQLIAAQRGLHHPAIDAQVALVDARLEANARRPRRDRQATSTSCQKPKRPPTCAISGRGLSYCHAERGWRLPSMTTS